MKKKNIGDKITAEIVTASQTKIKISGVVKDITRGKSGRETYIVSKGQAEDFRTRNIIK